MVGGSFDLISHLLVKQVVYGFVYYLPRWPSLLQLSASGLGAKSEFYVEFFLQNVFVEFSSINNIFDNNT